MENYLLQLKKIQGTSRNSSNCSNWHYSSRIFRICLIRPGRRIIVAINHRVHLAIRFGICPGLSCLAFYSAGRLKTIFAPQCTYIDLKISQTGEEISRVMMSSQFHGSVQMRISFGLWGRIRVGTWCSFLQIDCLDFCRVHWSHF